MLVLELTVVLGHKSDLSMQLRYSGLALYVSKHVLTNIARTYLLLERLDIAEAARSSRQSSSTPISSRQYTLLKLWSNYTLLYKLTVDHCYQDLPGSGVEKPQQHFLLEGAVHSVSGHLYNCQFPVLDVKLGGYHPPQICYLDIGGSLKVR